MKAKPQPPKDLWARLEEETRNLPTWTPIRPEGAFTGPEYRDKLQLTKNQATDRLARLLKTGKIKKFGTTGRQVYYVLVDK